MNKDWDAEKPLSAAILAGGMSTRMGVDKAMLAIREDDPPMAAMVIDRVREVARNVMLIASNRPEYDQFGVRLIPDRFPGSAALGGIATALAEAESDHCLVVACDMPFLNVEVLKWMANRPRDYDVLIPYLAGESRQGSGFVYQTLHAIYGKACLPEIESRLAEGKRQVIGFFDKVRVVPIAETQVREMDPDLRSFFNANSPETVEQARVWLADAT
jgi:molybdopterin-guanine dinucleotide biosynthesis protein A